jgi:diguanylate cyclase (GGDEF)-like protein/PAS domain S-box-containing protein
VFSDVTEKYQVDESLRIAKKQLEIFFKYSPVALAMFDRNMCYLYASNQWQQDYGITDRNLHGVSHYEVFPEITETWKAVHQRALAGDLVRADNDRFIRSDGTDQWLQWEVRPWQERSGEVGGILIFTQDITRRKVAESALLEATSHLQATLNAIPDLLFEVDANGRVLSYHAHRNDLLAAPPDVFMGSTFAEVLPPAAAAICMNAMNEAAINGSSSGATYSLPLPHGETWFELSVAAMPVVEGATPRFILLARDITKRKNDEEELRRSEERRSIATNSGQIAIWEVDLFTGKLMWDDNCFLLYKIDKQTFKGTYEEWKQTIHPQDLDTVTKSFQNAVDGISEYDLTFRIIWPDGEVRYIEAHGEVQRNQSGVAQRVIGTNWDVTTIKTQQSQLEHIAHFDALTNLPNRVLLADRLQQSMLQCQRRSQQLAVAFMDLDGFKAINDQCGHAVGDQVLIGLAHRMNEVMRQGDTLARLGGDEFVAVLIDLEEKSAIEPLLDRLLATAAQPFHVDGHSLHVSASIGVTIYPQTIEIDADQLLRQADQSMYQAKLAGKNRYHIFDAVQDSSIRGIHESLQQIRSALKSREFVLYYQPKVNMRTGQVIGAEALIRWQHPEQGLLAPGLFLPVIEDHPLAVDIGEWVIDAALIQMELWISQGMDMRVSVNIGARQLQQGDFVERLRAILAMHPRINPNTLELEILETSALEDVAQISQLIQDCAQLGVSFALDDFGTGYSSLTYLKRLKVKTLKIDQSFVRDMLDDPDDLAILQGVIGLAGALRREVIAEGVETPAHGTALLQLGCELAQGYGIARPMPADQMLGWAATWKPDSSWSDLPWLGGNLHSRFE